MDGLWEGSLVGVAVSQLPVLAPTPGYDQARVCEAQPAVRF